MKPNVGSLRKFLKIHYPLARLIRKKKENTQITYIRNKRSNIRRDITNTKLIIRGHCKQLYNNKSDKLDEIDKFFDR